MKFFIILEKMNNYQLTTEQIERYSRQIVLKEVGGIGQQKLLKSKIVLVGAGGLGSPIAYYLAAAGIGNIKIVDFDVVELSNLHRQIIHFNDDLNKNKAQSACEKLELMNPDVNVEVINEMLTPSNVEGIISGADFVIDGSDNIPTKMLINDACINFKIPFTIAGVIRFNGQIISVVPEEKTTCYRCVFNDVVDGPSAMSCSQAGVIGLIPGIIGCIQANEAIKYLLKIGELITNKMLFLDLLSYRFSFINIQRNENCIACKDDAENLIGIYDYRLGDACRE